MTEFALTSTPEAAPADPRKRNLGHAMLARLLIKTDMTFERPLMQPALAVAEDLKADPAKRMPLDKVAEGKRDMAALESLDPANVQPGHAVTMTLPPPKPFQPPR